eukprot:Filipodium_phascolosomae@DN735_c0_g1_i1.p1
MVVTIRAALSLRWRSGALAAISGGAARPPDLGAAEWLGTACLGGDRGGFVGAGTLMAAVAAECRGALAGGSRRWYRHWVKARPEDFELSHKGMPENIRDIMKTHPNDLTFIQNYWYWRLRSEATILNPDLLPKKSYEQLARDLG